jgi:hypothetical protein
VPALLLSCSAPRARVLSQEGWGAGPVSRAIGAWLVSLGASLVRSRCGRGRHGVMIPDGGLDVVAVCLSRL